ncbi:MAG: methyltransferase domain-containing protein [Oscillospiraceae bacterium]|nr:methyltransferase domain-containing protein [Oscillospiraceae bacterium]
MAGYSDLAYFYDALTGNIDYGSIAQFIDRHVTELVGRRGILLDIACGTGSLCMEMSRLGYDVIGTDISESMLSAALERKYDSGLDIQYLCQDMRELDMYGTIDVTVCTLDSLNHLPSAADVRRVFDRVALFCEKDGLFIFDMNTPYKHREILADNTFVYDLDDVYCVWQSSFSAKDTRVDITLDIFERDGERYARYSDELSERAYPADITEGALEAAGFDIIGRYDGYTDSPANDGSERIVYVCRIKNVKNSVYKG